MKKLTVTQFRNIKSFKRNTILDLQTSCRSSLFLPKYSMFIYWLGKTLYFLNKKVEVTIRIVDEVEMCVLNMSYRKINKPTNILSFSYNSLSKKENQFPFIGDLILCKQIIEKEAKEQKKKVEAHWAHVTIHGLLHLFGYDHISKYETQRMQKLETYLLQTIGYNKPY